MKVSVIFGWQEKAPYEAKAAKRKQEYEKLMNAYNKKQVKYPFCIFFLFTSFLAILVTFATSCIYKTLSINPICRIALVVRATKGLRDRHL